MKAIHVLRKPLSESTVAANVLRHGTGAYNIDATRIAFTDNVNMEAQQRQQNSEGVIGGAFGAASLIGKAIPTYKPGGRWPANLVLQHLPDCKQSGTRSVGSGDRRINEGDEFYNSVHEGYTRPNRSSYTHNIAGQVRTYGTEVIAAWVCADGCPVAGSFPLEGRSTKPSASGVSTRNKGASLTGTGGTDTNPSYFDAGSASRFFKQVKP